jgi:hypothetical protein
MFSACRRADGADTHFDVRWQDGVLQFTGKLELLPQVPTLTPTLTLSPMRPQGNSPNVQELATYSPSPFLIWQGNSPNL